MISLLVEGTQLTSYAWRVSWPFIVLNGILIIGIGRIFWYKAMRRLDISKTIAIGSIFPLFSTLYLTIFLREIISPLQWAGVGV